MKQIKIYTKEDGKQPYKIWFDSLDNSVKQVVVRRLNKVVQGNYGDCKRLTEEIYELRFTIGKGYRIYFAITETEIILLLCGGDKSSQSDDIKKAKEYLRDHNRETQL